MAKTSVKHVVPGKCATLSTSDIDLSLSGMGAFHSCHCACGDLIRQPFRQRHLAERTVVAPEPFTVRILTIQCVCSSPPCSGFCGIAFTKHAEPFRRTISWRSTAQVQRRRDKRCPLLIRRDQVKRMLLVSIGGTQSFVAPRGPRGAPRRYLRLRLHNEFSWFTRSRKMHRRPISYDSLPLLMEEALANYRL